jgi:hypothetical protein
MHGWNSRCSGCPDKYTNFDCGCQFIESETCNPYGSTYRRTYCRLHNPYATPLQKEHIRRELLLKQIADLDESQLKVQQQDEVELEKLRHENNALEQLLEKMKE